jgi:hypothetical protein
MCWPATSFCLGTMPLSAAFAATVAKPADADELDEFAL